MPIVNVFFNVFDDVTKPIFYKLRQCRYRNIKLWAAKSTPDFFRYAKDVAVIDFDNPDPTLICYRWDVETANVTPECNGLQNLLARKILHNIEFSCVDGCKHCKSQIVLFQDAQHKTEYPKEIFKIPCFYDYNSVIEYARKKGVFEFSLDDDNLFVKRNDIDSVQGKEVYQNKKTKELWYLDNLHKDHYEVFEKTGQRHVGEADLNGVVDYDKADKSKHRII